MNQAGIFDAWAPTQALWTPWAKPVLFAHVDPAARGDSVPPRPAWIRAETFAQVGVGLAPLDYRTSARARAAIVADLPGVDGVATGLALAQVGFRPVPLYASLPAAFAVVPMDGVMRALAASAVELAGLYLPPDAPPAFLLDARRHGTGVSRRPGQFDNRSVTFRSDFPSAERLRSAGIDAIVVVRLPNVAIHVDVAEVLADWQARGLRLFGIAAGSGGPAQAIQLPRVPWWSRLALAWRRASLTRHPDGGFGAAITSQGG